MITPKKIGITLHIYLSQAENIQFESKSIKGIELLWISKDNTMSYKYYESPQEETFTL